MRVIFLALYLSISFSASAQQSQFDVRKVKWGMTQAQVLRSESIKPGRVTKSVISYVTRINGYPATIGYSFSGSRLHQVLYHFYRKHTSNNLYLEDFFSVSNTINKKYGEPIKTTTKWENDVYKDDAKMWGLAIAIGYLRISNFWKTDRTVLSQVIGGDNFEVEHYVVYMSKEKALGLVGDESEVEF